MHADPAAEERIKSHLTVENLEQMTETVTISLFSLLCELNQMTTNVVTCSPAGRLQEQDIMTNVVTCLKQPTWKILRYFIKNGAASAWILRYKLQVHRRAVYRSIEDLRKLDLIQPKTTVKPSSRRKRSAVIWAIPTATERQVVEAVRLYTRLTSPIGLRAEALGMDFIEHVIQKRRLSQITGTDILNYLIERQVAGHERPDIANMIADLLKENGYTVWRTGK